MPAGHEQEGEPVLLPEHAVQLEADVIQDEQAAEQSKK